jgi:putative iron-dependent peroxidase
VARSPGYEAGFVVEETSSWPYLHDRDLTGFIDGSENPTLIEAPEVAIVSQDSPGRGGTILLLQKWAHDAAAWESLTDAEQERVIGRTKPDSVELDDKPDESHVARTDQDTFGHIFRRNMPTAPSPTTARCSSASAPSSAARGNAREHGRADNRLA